MVGLLPHVRAHAERVRGRALKAARKHRRRWRWRRSARGSSLARRARAQAVASPPLRALCSGVDAFLRRAPRRRVAVLVDARSGWLAAAIADRWPRLEVVCAVWVSASEHPGTGTVPPRLTSVVGRTPSERHALLAAYGPFDAIVDAVGWSERERLQALRETFFHLRRRGIFLTTSDPGAAGQGPDGSVGEFVRRMERKSAAAADTTSNDDPDWPYARAFGRCAVERGVVEVENQRRVLAKLRYREMDVVLARRTPSPGELLSELPAVRWPSRAEVVQNRVGRTGAFPPELSVPALGLRVYHHARCLPYQVLVVGGLVLPDSYRHYTAPRLANRRLRELTPYFDDYKQPVGLLPRLAGKYFYLGSEFPQAFGHVMTEQLSRLWAWQEAKQRYPGLRALVPVRKGDTLTSFEQEVFRAAGIGADELVPVRGPVRVDELVAAAPMLVNISYIHPDMARLWDRVGARLRAGASSTETPDKIFISRRQGGGRRDCRNGEEVERIFRESGFAIVFPEDYSLSDQVAMFEGARAIAGYAGSGMFNLQFCREPKDVLLIRTTSYGARNEYLIASIRGHRLRVLWCEPDIPQPPGGWSRAAFSSSFAVDLERDEAFLREQLSQMPDPPPAGSDTGPSR